jgi:hypothetical protein
MLMTLLLIKSGTPLHKGGVDSVALKKANNDLSLWSGLVYPEAMPCILCSGENKFPFAITLDLALVSSSEGLILFLLGSKYIVYHLEETLL